MSERPPTAEELLTLFIQWERFGDWAAHHKFIEGLPKWMDAQGPVTREWFQERFGGLDCVVARHGDPRKDCWGILLYYDCFLGFPIVRLTYQTKSATEYGIEWALRRATRNQLEAMVQLLGRKDGD
jgi:hypothetical protein